MPIQTLHLRSSVQGKEPVAGSATGQLPVGSIGVNFNAAEPFLTIQDSAGNIRRIAGIKVDASAPATPTAGEAWLDTTIATKPVFKVYDGTAWQGAGSSTSTGGSAPASPTEGDLWVDTSVAGSPVLKVYDGTSFVAVAPDATTSAKGVVQLADAAAVTAGTTGRVVTADQLKATNDALATATAGGLSNVTGTAPITVSGTGATRAVAVSDATTSAKGVVQLADAAAVAAGTVGLVVDASQLKSTNDSLTTAQTNITNLQTATADATTSAKGVVQLADAAAVTAGTAGLVVTADQLKATNDAVATAVSGGITAINGTAPITVTGTGNTRTVAVADASDAAKGVVQLADAAAITAGTVGRVVDAAQLKEATPTSSETVKGIVELATAAETTTGTDNTRAVHPAGLKVELDKKAPLASPALTGTPTAPTAAAGTNTTQVATTAFVAAADDWTRTGTELSPKTAGDSVFTSGAVKVGGTTAAPNITVKADGGITANTNGLVYDAVTKRLGIGTASPVTTLDVNGDVTISDKIIHAGNTNTAIRFPAADTFSIETAGSERVRVEGSGRLLVGTSSAIGNGDGAVTKGKLEVHGTSYYTIDNGQFSADAWGPTIYLIKSRGVAVGAQEIVQSGDQLGDLRFAGSDGTRFQNAATILCRVDGTPGANNMPGALSFLTTPSGSATPVERMRISSNGTISTSQALGTLTAFSIQNSTNSGAQTLFALQGGTYTTSDTTTKLIALRRGDGTEIGSVIRNGTTTVNYATSSDYRLKENIQPLTGAIASLAALKPSRFNFIGDTRTVDGFIAHEAQAVVPECVTGTKDEVDADGKPVYQGIDQSKLVPLLTAALQEALAEIESLKARVTALEP